MRLLHRELTNPTDRSDDAIAALVNLVSLELGRLVAREPEDAVLGRLAAWQFRKIRERLAQGGSTPTVAELATLCGISPRHLHRQFLALTGKTVADYIETSRIEEAKRACSRYANGRSRGGAGLRLCPRQQLCPRISPIDRNQPAIVSPTRAAKWSSNAQSASTLAHISIFIISFCDPIAIAVRDEVGRPT